MLGANVHNVGNLGFEFSDKVFALLKRNIKRTARNENLHNIIAGFVTNQNPSLGVREVYFLRVNERHVHSPSGKIADAIRCFSTPCTENLNGQITRGWA